MSNFYVFENFGTQNQIFLIFPFASVISNVKTHILAKKWSKMVTPVQSYGENSKNFEKNGRKSKN